MTLAATVLIPTHDHGPTLLRSVRSATAQTVEDVEILVVGDGVPDVTREVMAELCAEDERIRFVDNPKGPRHGEIHRHAALQGARGEIVCYLSDDDLWLPDHVEELRGLLEGHDFAHTLPLSFSAEGEVSVFPGDLEPDDWRQRLFAGQNWIPLSNGGHSLELYRRCEGWRTTPSGIPTDLYMWQQLLAAPGCRGVSGVRPTALHFPSLLRGGWSSERRLAELDHWAERAADPRLHAALDALGREHKRLDGEARALGSELEHLRRLVGDLDRELQQRDRTIASLAAELGVIAASVTWRLRRRLLGVPGLRSAAKALARRAARPAAEPSRPAPTPGPTPPATGSPGQDLPSDSQARPPDPSTR
jgi:hypothetical protein